MFHLFHWKLKQHWDEIYLENDSLGILVEYVGKKKKWTWFLHPVLDTNHNTIKYFAFDRHKQKSWFLRLLKIQWIWWKSGYQIAMRNEKDLESALKSFDVGYFTALPGVGPKTAKRILVELKSSLDIEDVKKLSIDDGLLKDILKSLHDLWYERKKVKEILPDVPYPLDKKHLAEVMKRLVEHL